MYFQRIMVSACKYSHRWPILCRYQYYNCSANNFNFGKKHNSNSNISQHTTLLSVQNLMINSSLPEHIYVSKRTFSLSRSLFNEVDESELKKGVESLTDQFMEARELLDDARESKGSVYFSDDVTDAQDAVKETLTQYKDLLNKISDKQKQHVMRSIGLKMEELKAQLSAMEEEMKSDD